MSDEPWRGVRLGDVRALLRPHLSQPTRRLSPCAPYRPKFPAASEVQHLPFGGPQCMSRGRAVASRCVLGTVFQLEIRGKLMAPTHL